MAAFTPISPAATRQILKGISQVDEGLFLSAFVEAGRVRAYADVIETLTYKGGQTEVHDSRIPPILWRRIVAEGKLGEVLASSSTRLDGDGLLGGRPAVKITGVRFNADNVRRVASQHAASAPVTQPVAPVKKKAGKPAAVDDAPKPVTDAPPLIEIVTPNPPPQQTVTRMGLPADVVCVSVPEACSILGISRSKLYKLFDDGSLEKVKVGGRTQVKTDGIRKLLGV